MSFKALHPDARFLAKCLQAVQIKEMAICTLIEGSGFHVAVEEAGSLRSALTVDQDHFTSFEVDGTIAPFCIRIENILNILALSGDISGSGKGKKGKKGKETEGRSEISTSVLIGSPVELEMKEDSSILYISLKGQGSYQNDCELDTYVLPSQALGSLSVSGHIQEHIMMKSSWLHEALSEVEEGGEVTAISTSSQDPFLRVSVEGSNGSSVVECNQDSDILESLDCTVPATFKYRTRHLLFTLPALDISSRVALRRDHRGFLAIQVMLIRSDSKIAYVEYILAPSVEDD